MAKSLAEGPLSLPNCRNRSSHTGDSPLSSSFVGQMPRKSMGGGDPQGDYRRNRLTSISIPYSAMAVIRFRWNGWPAATSVSSGPSPTAWARLCLVLVNSSSGKGCFLSPRLMEHWTSWAQDCASSAMASPRCASLECSLRGGGRLPGDGLPPPSRSGLVLNPDWTMIGSSPSVIARKKGEPRRIYRSVPVRLALVLRCSWGGSVEKVVLFWTTCPRRHWSRWIFRWCMVLAHCRYTSVAQIDEHPLAAGALLHSTGSLGCSKKEWKSSDSLAWCTNAVITICRSSRRLSLSVSSGSARELDSSPHLSVRGPPKPQVWWHHHATPKDGTPAEEVITRLVGAIGYRSSPGHEGRGRHLFIFRRRIISVIREQIWAQGIWVRVRGLRVFHPHRRAPIHGKVMLLDATSALGVLMRFLAIVVRVEVKCLGCRGLPSTTHCPAIPVQQVDVHRPCGAVRLGCTDYSEGVPLRGLFRKLWWPADFVPQLPADESRWVRWGSLFLL